jgi:hypothetical protein
MLSSNIPHVVTRLESHRQTRPEDAQFQVAPQFGVCNRESFCYRCTTTVLYFFLSGADETSSEVGNLVKLTHVFHFHNSNAKARDIVFQASTTFCLRLCR